MKTARKVIALAAASALAVSLASCAGGDAPSGGEQIPLDADQTLQMLNYGGWMGASNVESFEAEHPNVTINQSDLPSGGVGGRENSGAYDFAMLGSMGAGTSAEQGILADFDAAAVPNLSNIESRFVEAYPWGIPLEQGKVGIIYRSDKIADPPTSWKELFERMPELSGRVAFPDYDTDTLGIALLALGYDLNTENLDELEEAAELVISVKPHIKAFLGSDVIKALTDGTVDLVVSYDYNTAESFGVDPTIEWVAPSEGLPGYIDGWVAFKDSPRQAATTEFMNWVLDLEQYADFINTTGASYLTPDVEPLLDPSIRDNPALAYDPDVQVFYLVAVNGETNAKRSELWERIKAS